MKNNDTDNLFDILNSIVKDLARLPDRNIKLILHNEGLLDQIAITEQKIHDTNKQIVKMTKFAKLPGCRAITTLILLYMGANLFRRVQIKHLSSQMIR